MRESEMTTHSRIAMRLAAALLLKRGELSLEEIKALPLVDDEDFAIMVANILAARFNAERYERSLGKSASQFEDVIRLVAPLNLGARRNSRLGSLSG